MLVTKLFIGYYSDFNLFLVPTSDPGCIDTLDITTNDTYIIYVDECSLHAPSCGNLGFHLVAWSLCFFVATPP